MPRSRQSPRRTPRRISARPARAAAALVLCAFATLGGVAAAAPPHRPAASPFELTPPFSIDLFQGPLLAPVRVSGLGGAYAGLAEGIAGIVANAAAPAVRDLASVRFFDADLDASISTPVSLFDDIDFDDSGDVDADYSRFLYLAAGATLHVGAFGIGFFGDLARYSVDIGGAGTDVTVGRYHLLAGWHLLGGQLVVGGGARAVSLGVSAADTELTVLGAAPEFGVLVRPDWSPFRVGLSFRNSVSAGTSVGYGATLDPGGLPQAGGLVLPERVVLPWEIELGGALQVGPRPLNPAWVDPVADERALERRYEERHRSRLSEIDGQLVAIGDPSTRAALREKLVAEERERSEDEAATLEQQREALVAERRARANNWPREHVLLLLELLVTGAVPDAVHLERFLSQGQLPTSAPCTAVQAGTRVSLSPRFGLETEPVPQWIHIRFGGYFEPNRYRYEPDGCASSPGRQHFTFGGDVKLFSTTFWGLVPEVTYKLQAYADLAPRFQSLGLGLGVWH